MKLKLIASVILLSICYLDSYSQVLKLKDALYRTQDQYDKIKVKQQLVNASAQNTAFQKQQYLPDFTLSAQQSFGSINVQHGPMYAYGGLASAATSMPLAEQNWNAAFGSLYFANINWNVFSFGRIKNQVELGSKKELTAKADLQQEIFQQQIKVSAAYLNLLASQRIKFVQEKNAERAQVFYEMTNARAKSGLIPEVDAQLAKAEWSNAKSLQIKAYDKELEWSKQLAVLINDDFKIYQLDSLYSTSLPNNVLETAEGNIEKHPYLQWQQSKINESEQSIEVLKAHKKPNVSAFGVVQGRGSGFEANYAQDNSAYSPSYLKGVGIDRGNYLLGISLSWNITNIFRFNTKIKEQQFLTQSLQYTFDAQQKELKTLSQQANAQLKNAYLNFDETKIQLDAAALAHKQQTALYENGLTTLVDFTQALYSLNRAEIDYEIAQNNVWQALLLLASAQGDIQILIP
ncbi:TolC family protein [Chryseobacterium balustinum]|uniref:Outer membrane protein TolC n=1 Tax=Chryseobacterium balustinum TaxID=246 RepID=A0AAX2IJY4_9FLAO|nr:TolC family protein [Chryseobacterium balustinum]AZB30483.1 TolC family protein [Chryseobacterium balustinum]SKB48407.1 Outer membrane protein TolC [Chryseobacterium balustinum]SQA89109.1 type I secretion outer membrane protein, TolC family [Chryseobacterium balustinum]